VDDKTVARYKMASIDLAANNGQKADAVYLPIPAVYIINKQGEITYRYFESDYRKRPYVKEILENLKGVK
jgi:peroxiredoxin